MNKNENKKTLNKATAPAEENALSDDALDAAAGGIQNVITPDNKSLKVKSVTTKGATLTSASKSITNRSAAVRSLDLDKK